MATGTRAQPLAAHRRPTAEEQESKVDNVNLLQGGNSQTYLLRRIARDQPQLLGQLDTHPDTAAVAIR